jgi:DnaJ-domain-containing protein 1
LPDEVLRSTASIPGLELRIEHGQTIDASTNPAVVPRHGSIVHDFDALDHYELLGIPRSASPGDIKRAYRREISKYHPDRFAGADAETQRYASERSQRINEAYRVLTDQSARTEYNLGRMPSRQPRTPPPPPQTRDHQGELYAQAVSHLAGGRPLQAMAALQQLQRINPFYRDSAELMARAKSQLANQQGGSRRPYMRRILAAAGVGGVVAAAAVAAWVFARPAGAPGQNPTGSRAETPPSATALVVGAAATVAPTSVSTVTAAPTAAPTELPSATPQPSPEPTAAPTAAPTELPSATLQPSPEPTKAPEGELALSDTFAARSWAQMSGRGWSVGYSGNQYHISADPGYGTIWSFRSGPSGNRSYAVDVQVSSGRAGLMVRFEGESSYLVVDLDPATGTYRVVRERGSSEETLAADGSEAIARGAEATNRLEAALRGDTLDVFVNNQSLVSVDVSGTGDSPRYGLVATAGEATADALFDNLEIRTLP